MSQSKEQERAQRDPFREDSCHGKFLSQNFNVKLFLDQKGQSLVTVLTAAVIGVIVVSGIVSMLVTLQNGASSVKFRTDADTVNEEIRALLSNVDACTNSFKGNVITGPDLNVLALKDGSQPTPVTQYVEGGIYGDRTLILTNMALKEYADGAKPGTAEMTLYNSFTSNKQVAGAKEAMPRKVKISFQKNAGNIVTSCIATSKMSDSIWMRNSAKQNNIYFMAPLPEGNVGVGTSNPLAKLEVSDTISGLGTVHGIINSQYSTDNEGAQLTLRKGRGGSAATPLAVVAGDLLGGLLSDGFNGAAYGRGPQIQFFAEENFTPAASGSSILFRTTPPGTAVPSEAMRLTGSGYLGVGTTAPLGGVHINDGTDAGKHLVFSNKSDGKTWGLYKRSSSYVSPNNLSFNYWNGVTNNEVLNLVPNGSVGFGTATPTHRIHVKYSDFLDNGIQIESTGIAGPELSLKSSTVNGREYFLVSTAAGNTIPVGYFGIYDNVGGGTGSEGYKLVIDPTGNVGIGTKEVAPLSVLTVEDPKAGEIRGITSISETNGAGWGGQFLGASSHGSRQVPLPTRNGDSLGVFASAGYTGTGFVRTGWVTFNAKEDFSLGGYGTQIEFVNIPLGGTSAPLTPPSMVIAPGGKVGIGTVTPAYKLDVNGSIRGYGVTDSSDRSLKHDIQPLPEVLEKILQLRGVSYYWNDAKTHGDQKQIGLVAQEVEKVYPELVETDQQGLKSVNYSHLVAPLIEALKALFAKVCALEERLKALLELVMGQMKTTQGMGSEVALLKEENTELRNQNRARGEELKILKLYLCKKDPQASFCE